MLNSVEIQLLLVYVKNVELRLVVKDTDYKLAIQKILGRFLFGLIFINM